MIAPRRAFNHTLHAVWLAALTACGAYGAQTRPLSQPRPAPPAQSATPAPLPGLRIIDSPQPAPLTFAPLQSLLLTAERPAESPGEQAHAFRVLTGAYPQVTGGGKVSVIERGAAVLIEGETYTYLRGVRPITVTKRIRTYSPATEVVVWCSDKTHSKDFVFAAEGETTVVLRRDDQDPPPSQVLRQGYCTRVIHDKDGKPAFQDGSPIKIESLKDAPIDSEEYRMYLFFLQAHEYARLASLEPKAAPPPPPKPMPTRPPG